MARRRKTEPDDPDVDGTPLAHPSYWRGEKHGVWGAVNRIREVLDGGDDGSGIIGDTYLEKLRRDLLMLMKKVKKAKCSTKRYARGAMMNNGGGNGIKPPRKTGSGPKA